MKKLHLFILKSYLGPLAVTFFISLFILLMQFIWRSVDLMVGKGLELITIAELLFYACLQVVPMSLPLAILLASLMTFGSLGENYELTAIKASGVSLLRLMKPLIVLTVLIAFLAFGFSNNVLPWVNLKFFSLFHSVRMTRPSMELKEQAFYTEIKDFGIKIDRKDKESDLMYGVVIYDHQHPKNPNTTTTHADSGKLQMIESNGLMKLTLMDGVCFDENIKGGNRIISNRDKQRFRKNIFKKQISFFEFNGNNFERADESGFVNYNEMKNMHQLSVEIDSFQKKQNEVKAQITKQSKSFNFLDDIVIPEKNINRLDETNDPDVLLTSLSSTQQLIILEKAKREAQSGFSAVRKNLAKVTTLQNKIISHDIERHRKYTLSFACFIFFFIGAPLGAIIRKGGIGMPVVISIIFFIIYYMIDTFGVNLAGEGVWPVYQGMWLSSLILFPLASFLTYHSVNDSALLNMGACLIFFKKLLKREKYELKNRLDKE